jgi:hypothetical protein
MVTGQYHSVALEKLPKLDFPAAATDDRIPEFNLESLTFRLKKFVLGGYENC